MCSIEPFSQSLPSSRRIWTNLFHGGLQGHHRSPNSSAAHLCLFQIVIQLVEQGRNILRPVVYDPDIQLALGALGGMTRRDRAVYRLRQFAKVGVSTSL
jgi:hypothetical protein